jgi:aspartate/methionine/tyrosine aminotransferase
MDALRRAVTPKTRAILLVSPNNPTGSIVSQDEQLAISDLGLPIISDEVFSGFLFGAAKKRYRSAVALSNHLVFVLDGLSKSMGLPQCKLGFTTIAGAPHLVREARERLEIICDSYLSVGTPVQLALPALLTHEEARRQVIVDRLSLNWERLRELTRDSSVTVLTLDGGFSALLEVPRTRGETEWVQSLMSERGVLVQPGWFFDMPREAYLVVSLLTLPATFAEGITALVAHVDGQS